MAIAFALPAAGQGEPGFWEIVGVGGVLRRAPLDGGGVIARPPAGTVVKNLGCQDSRGRRWCQVQLLDEPGVVGWIGNNNLRIAVPEGKGPSGSLPVSAPAPGGSGPGPVDSLP